MTFQEWLDEVDEMCGHLLGLSRDDMTDQPYDRWYEEGKQPLQAAAQAALNNGYGK